MFEGTHPYFAKKAVPVVNNGTRIDIPPGRFEAPNDHRVKTEFADLGRGREPIEIFQQTQSGNCAELTALNAAIVMQRAGLVIHPAVEAYLNLGVAGMRTVEANLVLPLLLQGQEMHPEMGFVASDVDNLMAKLDNPIESLTNANALLLFRIATSNLDSPFVPTELSFAQPSVEKFLEDVDIHVIAAVFVGARGHATCYIKLNDKYIYIDPFSPNEVLKQSTRHEMEDHLRRVYQLPDTVISINRLATK